MQIIRVKIILNNFKQKIVKIQFKHLKRINNNGIIRILVIYNLDNGKKHAKNNNNLEKVKEKDVSLQIIEKIIRRDIFWY